MSGILRAAGNQLAFRAVQASSDRLRRAGSQEGPQQQLLSLRIPAPVLQLPSSFVELDFGTRLPPVVSNPQSTSTILDELKALNPPSKIIKSWVIAAKGETDDDLGGEGSSGMRPDDLDTVVDEDLPDGVEIHEDLTDGVESDEDLADGMELDEEMVGGTTFNEELQSSNMIDENALETVAGVNQVEATGQGGNPIEENPVGQGPNEQNLAEQDPVKQDPVEQEQNLAEQTPAEQKPVQQNPVVQEQNPAEQEQEQNPAEQEQNPIEQEQNPIEQQQEQTPVEQKQEQNPVEQEQNPIEQEQNPIEQEQEQTPVEQKQEQSPVEQEQEQSPVEQEQNPIEQEQNPIEQEQNPAEQEQSPIEQDEVEQEQNRAEQNLEQIPVEENPIDEGNPEATNTDDDHRSDSSNSSSKTVSNAGSQPTSEPSSNESDQTMVEQEQNGAEQNLEQIPVEENPIDEENPEATNTDDDHRSDSSNSSSKTGSNTGSQPTSEPASNESDQTMIAPEIPTNSLRNDTTFPPLKACRICPVDEQSFEGISSIDFSLGHTAFVGLIDTEPIVDEADGTRWISVVDKLNQRCRIIFTEWDADAYPYTSLESAVSATIIILYPRVKAFDHDGTLVEDALEGRDFEFWVGQRTSRLVKVLHFSLFDLIGTVDSYFFALADNSITEMECFECGSIATINTMTGRPKASERKMACRACGCVYFCNAECQVRNQERPEDDELSHFGKSICDGLQVIRWFTRKNWRAMRWDFEDEATRLPLMYDAWAGDEQIPCLEHKEVLVGVLQASEEGNEGTVRLHEDRFQVMPGFPPPQLV
ncbi:hypothetical protein BJ508DRAFT_330655 [Ascobolus immersus RN42]|uniref:Uncharacterized protein n=1 Tax=Ascobolus immersus RN42 TaxID=1160509 RepID=A0A3N4HSR2_ASCIM|nr:hypothetical protein BJ508DRAFT_330655 [Ascobolus immersus RN42]